MPRCARSTSWAAFCTAFGRERIATFREALDLLAEKLRAIREAGFVDENGYPKLAVTFGAGGTAPAYLGGFPAFMSAWGGPRDQGIGSGQGMKCVHSEHLYGEFWHRAFTVAPDMPRSTYVLSFGNNGDVSGGVIGVWRHAEARGRGVAHALGARFADNPIWFLRRVITVHPLGGALRERAADVTAIDGDGTTALHWAAQREEAAAGALLLGVIARRRYG